MNTHLEHNIKYFDNLLLTDNDLFVKLYNSVCSDADLTEDILHPIQDLNSDMQDFAYSHYTLLELARAFQGFNPNADFYRFYVVDGFVGYFWADIYFWLGKEMTKTLADYFYYVLGEPEVSDKAVKAWLDTLK